MSHLNRIFGVPKSHDFGAELKLPQLGLRPRDRCDVLPVRLVFERAGWRMPVVY
jgi:hypothetical protein